MPNTDLQFLSDTFQFEVGATITESGEDDDGPYVVTGATVFYPGGGGQEPDKGVLITGSGIVWPIEKAILKNQAMHHYLPPSEYDQELITGKQVTIRIDREHRLKNAQLHTGGHLLSSVVYEKLRLPLKPVKGFHYQKGAYIEFEPEAEMPGITEEALNQALAEDIAGQLKITASLVSADDPAFQEAFKPEGFMPPADQALRLVRIHSYQAYPCGGTHLHHTSELKRIRVKHIRHKKGHVRISYEVGEG